MRRALAAFAVVGLLSSPGCRARPKALAYDLAARATVAERWSQADVILFDRPEADPRQGVGVETEASRGPAGPYRPASREAEVVFQWQTVEPRVAILDAEPWAGVGEQSFEVELNGAAVDHLRMSEGRRRYMVPLPPRAQHSGENRLRLAFSGAVVEGGATLAAALYSLVVGPDDDSLVDLVDPGAPSPFAVVEENGVPGIVLVGPALLRFAVRLPGAAELRFSPALDPAARRAAGRASLRVLLQREDGEEREVWSRVLDARQADPGEQVVTLGGAPGDVVRITLAVGAAGSPRFAWGRFAAPRILGHGDADPLRPAPLPAGEDARADGLRRALGKANVVLVILDAARARQFGTYGYERPTTPEIDRIAAESVVFDRAYTPAVFTLAAMSSLWTSQLPDELHPGGSLKSPLPDDHLTLAALLSGRGIHTAGFIANGMAGAAYGLDRGFDEFHEVYREHGTSAGAFLEVLPSWLSAHRDERFFAYVHYREPHFPYDPPPPWDTRFGKAGPIPVEARRDWDIFRQYNRGARPFGAAERAHLVSLYDGNLGFVDQEVGKLRAALVDQGLWDRTVMIVAADHGEALHERGYTGHNVEVYETSAHIPLIVRLPPASGSDPRRVSALVDLLDLAPTIADVFGSLGEGGSARQFQGRSLLPVSLGAPGKPAVLTRSVWERPRYALRDERYEYALDTRDGTEQLFDLQKDTDEERNLAGEKPLRTAFSREALRSFLLEVHRAGEAPAAPPRLTREQCENLRTLGYVSGECP